MFLAHATFYYFFHVMPTCRGDKYTGRIEPANVDSDELDTMRLKVSLYQ
jgi:hypothetical protein